MVHEKRPDFAARHPLNVTLRLRADVGSIRRDHIVAAIRRAIASGHKDSFRVTAFNVLSNHIHLVGEADGAGTLGRGVQGLAIRLARVQNARHHAAERGVRLSGRWFDPYSSTPWFAGWRTPLPSREPWERELLSLPSPVAAPRSWFLETGWKRGGCLALDEQTQ